MKGLTGKFEDRIQNAILIAIDSIVAPKIELAFRSINASSGRDATSVTANSEHGEQVGITAAFENISERNNTLHVLNVNEETRNNIPDEVSELSVRGTHYDLQSHTHHSNTRHKMFQQDVCWRKVFERNVFRFRCFSEAIFFLHLNVLK